MLSFLPHPPANLVIWGGLVIAALVVVQMLIGYRKIRFKGRKHLKVHKAVAWLLTVGVLGHGFAAMLYLGVFD